MLKYICLKRKRNYIIGEHAYVVGYDFEYVMSVAHACVWYAIIRVCKY